MEGKGVTARDFPSSAAEQRNTEQQSTERRNGVYAESAPDMVGSMAAPEGEMTVPADGPEPDGETLAGGETLPGSETLTTETGGETTPDDENGEGEPGGGGGTPRGGNEREVSHLHAPRVRVDARLLEATLLNLRKRIAAIPLVLDIPGADQVTAERVKLLSEIDDYLLPRVRQSAAPILVALVGSTGAGKSTLVNSIVGAQVSLTGVRRPTTNSPVLACHPDDIGWFAENMFLPTLPRVRQQGLGRPGQDGLLVLAASEGMTKGIALLDTPDIDSVVRAHHDFAYQFLDASDLWLFMTSANRYADAPVWEILQHARERGAALGVILSRVPSAHRAELAGHFNAMLDANGITVGGQFMIPETGIVDGMLPVEVFQPIRDWLAETAQHTDRRVAVLTQTMAGVLDTFKIRVPKLAAHVDAQAMLRSRLRHEAEVAYSTAAAEFDAGTRQARLLRGEILARWQDYAASGDLSAALRNKRASRKGRRARKGTAISRESALNAALRAAVGELVGAVADRAAERVTRVWRGDPAGATLLASAEESLAQGERAKREFESAFGPSGTSPHDGTPEAGAAAGDTRDAAAKDQGLSQSSADLPARVTRAFSAWQDQVLRHVQAENLARRGSGSGYESVPLSLVVLVAMLGEDGNDANEEIVTVPRELLKSAFGTVESRQIVDRVRADLGERVRLLLDEDLLRFVEILDAAGPIDPVAGVRLYQAEYSLEAVR
jgi:energy-coupling factor transporter ATP-binding protein EcfA2